MLVLGLDRTAGITLRTAPTDRVGTCSTGTQAEAKLHAILAE